MSDPGSDLQKSGIRSQRSGIRKSETRNQRNQKTEDRYEKLSSTLAPDMIQGRKIKTKKKMDQVTGTD